MKRCAIFALLLTLIAGTSLDRPLHADDKFKDGFAATSAGVRIHYLQSGDASSSRALILIPGWRLPAYLWNEPLIKFAGTNRMMAIDPRSQDKSTKTVDGNTPESRARDLHDVLAGLKVSTYVLVGWSQGAQDLSAYLQQFRTGSVAAIVLVDSPVSYGLPKLNFTKNSAKRFLRTSRSTRITPKSFPKEWSNRFLGKPHPDLDLPRIVQSTPQTPTNTGVAMLIADIFGADRRPALAKLDRPALVIASGNSPLLDVQKEMAALFPMRNLWWCRGLLMPSSSTTPQHSMPCCNSSWNRCQAGPRESSNCSGANKG